jgi:ATP/maltotriose-dependent transcriptional regulator MalT
MDTRTWTERGEAEARNDLRAGNLPRGEAALDAAMGELLAHVALSDGEENAAAIEREARRYLDGAEADDAAVEDLAAARAAVIAGYCDEVRRIWAAR